MVRDKYELKFRDRNWELIGREGAFYVYVGFCRGGNVGGDCVWRGFLYSLKFGGD